MQSHSYFSLLQVTVFQQEQTARAQLEDAACQWTQSKNHIAVVRMWLARALSASSILAGSSMAVASVRLNVRWQSVHSTQPVPE